jgi:hypothetical protein
MVTWILGLSRVLPIGEQVFLTDHDLSYARTGDIFLFNALHREDDVKQRCVAGLRSLLMVEGVAKQSIIKIRQNLKMLGIEYSDEEFARIRTETARRSGVATGQEIFEIFRKCTTSNPASEASEGQEVAEGRSGSEFPESTFFDFAAYPIPDSWECHFRLERGRTQATIRTLKRIAEATGHSLVVDFQPIKKRQ